MVKVFIENEAGSTTKHEYNEKTFELFETKQVSAPYPYPYGFIVETTAEDGDNLDCYIITERDLKTGTFVECDVLGLLESHETSWNPEKAHHLEEDHNVLMAPEGEEVIIDSSVEQKLRDFADNVFKHVPGKKIIIGRFWGVAETEEYIERLKD